MKFYIYLAGAISLFSAMASASYPAKILTCFDDISVMASIKLANSTEGLLTVEGFPNYNSKVQSFEINYVSGYGSKFVTFLSGASGDGTRTRFVFPEAALWADVSSRTVYTSLSLMKNEKVVHNINLTCSISTIL